jgi:hypothetical protein
MGVVQTLRGHCSVCMLNLAYLILHVIACLFFLTMLSEKQVRVLCQSWSDHEATLPSELIYPIEHLTMEA